MCYNKDTSVCCDKKGFNLPNLGSVKRFLISAIAASFQETPKIYLCTCVAVFADFKNFFETAYEPILAEIRVCESYPKKKNQKKN